TPVDDASAVLGSILRTDPAAGAMADRDTPIALAQAAGAPPVAVPDLNGRTADDASAALKALGLVPNVIRGSGVDAVTAQDPAPTTMARPGTVVTLQIGTVG
ncbi:MAG TPA: PASTA domain-containing protein, partial [Microthrixaceae bacterium]|nr:PASTA domain-containing protein [Microthrixaceae bacterium]